MNNKQILVVQSALDATISPEVWSRAQAQAVMPLYPATIDEEGPYQGHISPTILPDGTWTCELAITKGRTDCPPEQRWHFIYTQRFVDWKDTECPTDMYIVRNCQDVYNIIDQYQIPVTRELQVLVLAFSNFMRERPMRILADEETERLELVQVQTQYSTITSHIAHAGEDAIHVSKAPKPC